MHTLNNLKQVSHKELIARRLNLVPVLVAQQLVLAPLYFYLPVGIFLFNCLILMVVYFSKLNHRFIIKKWFKVTITLIAAVGIFYFFQRLSGRDAGVSLIAIMYGLKIVEIESRRDVYVLLLLGFFILLASFLFTQSPLIVIYQFLPILAILYGLQSIHIVNQPSEREGGDNLSPNLTKAFIASFIAGKSSFKSMIKQLLTYLAIAIPIMTLLFLFFPRLSGPIWKIPGNKHATSGISDSMSPGEISGLHLSDKIAFRVKFAGIEPKSDDLYWRTLVLDQFDGLTWSHKNKKNNNEWKHSDANSKKLQLSEYQEQYMANRESYFYEIALEATQQNWLTFLDRAIEVNAGAQILTDFSSMQSNKIYGRIKYKGQSVPRLPIEFQLSPQEKDFYTQLPSRYNPRSINWAVKRRKSVQSDQQFIQSVLKTINQKEYYYTLSPPIMAENTVDSFWLDKQKGFCEHYSGALVFLARAANIPARVVIGYQGAEKNPFSDYWIVRYSNAHAWTEIWFEGQGWIRVDPTAAIAEQRVEKQLLGDYSQRESLFGSFDSILMENIELGFGKRMSFWLDKVNSGWNDWFLEYNQSLQRQLMSKMGLSQFRKEHIALVVFLLIVGFLLMISFYSQSTKKLEGPLSHAMALLTKKLAKFDIVMSPHEGVDNVLKLIRVKMRKDVKVSKKVKGQLSIKSLQKLENLLMQYQTLRYGKNNCSILEQKAFYNQVKKLKLRSSV